MMIYRVKVSGSTTRKSMGFYRVKVSCGTTRKSVDRVKVLVVLQENSEFAICHVVRHGNVNSFQNPSTVTNPTMGSYCIRLPLTLPCRTT